MTMTNPFPWPEKSQPEKTLEDYFKRIIAGASSDHQRQTIRELVEQQKQQEQQKEIDRSFGKAISSPTPVAKRDNKDKPRYSLVSQDALDGLIRVLEFGATKYDRDNWKKGLPYQSVVDSMMRHINAILRGELFDEESKEMHIDHVMCNAMFLSHFMKNSPRYNNQFNDLP